MPNRFKTIMLLSLLAIISAGFHPERVTSSFNWLDKVDPLLLTDLSKSDSEFLVFLSEQADLNPAAALKTKQEKGLFVYSRLKDTAERTQKPLLDMFKKQNIPHRSFWIANMIWAEGDLALVKSLALRSDVAHIYANPSVQMDIPQKVSLLNIPDLYLSLNTPEWNLKKVNADDVWAAGYRGEGVVIGGQDTGYDWQHAAIKEQYRGWNGSSADHNYAWHDAVHSGGGICGADSQQPCDDNNHGTHTMGIMVGDDGDSHQIGMAPGAKWIGCRNMDQGVGTPSTYSECFQWFLAPTDINGTNPRPDLAPDVINNSWSCPPYEGCTDANILLTVVENVRAAGILTVQSAGNSGPSCSTISDPAAIYDATFTVANTTSLDTISPNSSRGPVTIDSSNRQKPDISAPGTYIYSSVPGDSYALMSGTSMAAPHVVGLAALLISVNPALSGQVDQLERIITRNAVPLTPTETCGGLPNDSIPNNTYGWGRIDAASAYKNLQTKINKTASAASIKPGSTITYTLTVSQTTAITGTTNVIVTDTLPSNSTFITATVPYIQNENVIQWSFPSLGIDETRQFELVVGIPITYTGMITNWQYSISSDQIQVPVFGEPVTTYLGYILQLPLIIK